MGSKLTNSQIIAHCRRTLSHVPGIWYSKPLCLEQADIFYSFIYEPQGWKKPGFFAKNPTHLGFFKKTGFFAKKPGFYGFFAKTTGFFGFYAKKLGFIGFYGFYLSINMGNNFYCLQYMSFISKHMLFCYLYLLWLMVFPPRSYKYLHFTPTYFEFSRENQPFFSKNP